VTRTDLLESIAGDLPDVGEKAEVPEQEDGTLQALRLLCSAKYPSLATSSPGRRYGRSTDR
jgi:hypothetical protein